MFNRSTLTLGGAAMCGALLLNGCANHMSQRSEHEERIERKLLSHSLLIDVGSPAVLELPQRRVRINEQKTFEVTEFDVTRRYDRYTPYQPWREIYEVPLGAVAVVAGVGANVLNIFMFGQLPDSVTRDWLSYGVDGLNPAMNVQSNGRAQQSLAGIEDVQRDSRLEYSSLPWAERPVAVTAGKQTHELTTDRNGVLRLNLLDGPFAEQDLNHVGKLTITVEDAQDETHSDSTLSISSHLRRSLTSMRLKRTPPCLPARRLHQRGISSVALALAHHSASFTGCAVGSMVRPSCGMSASTPSPGSNTSSQWLVRERRRQRTSTLPMPRQPLRVPI